MLQFPRIRSLVIAAGLGAAAGCGGDAAAALPQPAPAAAAPAAWRDAPVAAWQLELLELCFAAAERMPLNPHVRNRARAQAALAMAALAAGLPQRAAGYAARIPNWQRGECLAEVALAAADRGDAAQAKELVARAAAVVRDLQTQGDAVQAWQLDRVRVTVARAHLRLGDVAAAKAAATDLEPTEGPRIELTRAAMADAASAREQLRQLDVVLQTASFDQARLALEACAVLFRRCHGDAEVRDAAEQRVRTACTQLPPRARLELLRDLALFSLQCQDRAKALELLGEARMKLEQARFAPEERTEWLARLATLRAEAGEPEAARAEAAAALAGYEAAQATVVDIYRAGALRQLIAAYHACGDTEAALGLARRTVEAGVANPNSRPRLDDLVATCALLVERGIAPDQALQTRIRQLAEGLGNPW